MRTRAITDRQLKQLCEALPWRDSLAMRLMRTTGLRVSDLLALRKTDMALRMAVREQKTGKTRIVRLTPALVRECARYGAMHRGEKLFTCDRSTLYRSVHSTALRLGFERISAHSARKAYARSYARKHGIEATQRHLGHTSMSTTLIYLHDL